MGGYGEGQGWGSERRFLCPGALEPKMNRFERSVKGFQQGSWASSSLGKSSCPSGLWNGPNMRPQKGLPGTVSYEPGTVSYAGGEGGRGWGGVYNWDRIN